MVPSEGMTLSDKAVMAANENKAKCYDYCATKSDAKKLRFDLIPPESLVGLAEVLTYGSIKYEDRNWEKGFKYSRVYAALMRHMTAWFMGEDVDSESHLSHLDHAAFCVAVLKTFTERGTGTDDRIRTDNHINGRMSEVRETKEEVPTSGSN